MVETGLTGGSTYRLAQILRAATFGAMAMALAAAAPAHDPNSEPSRNPDAAVPSEIERLLDVAQPPQTVAGEVVDGVALEAFYRPRNWQPAWTGDTAELRDFLAHAPDQGLASLPLHLKAIAARLDPTKPVKIAEGDLLLTDAVLRYADAMRGQRVDPADIEDDWLVPTPNFDALGFLNLHLADIVTALAGLEPAYNGYKALRDA